MGFSISKSSMDREAAARGVDAPAGAGRVGWVWLVVVVAEWGEGDDAPASRCRVESSRAGPAWDPL
jgi:hypothetical protein